MAGQGPSAPRPPTRWWPAWLILGMGGTAIAWIWLVRDIQRQDRNLQTAGVLLITLTLLFLWSVLFSRFRWRTRLLLLGGLGALLTGLPAFLEIGGVTGDLLPIVRWRWRTPRSRAPAPPLPQEMVVAPTPEAPSTNDYPQFLGPSRNAIVAGPPLARDWEAHPPSEIWRVAVGAAWSGFAVAGAFAVTQEQDVQNEKVVCYDLRSGKTLWSQTDPARYFTTIAGEGPRATPTIVGNRVLTVGATGIMNCLDLKSGARLWTKNILTDNHSHVPEWGLSGSPLVVGNLVVASAGGKSERSLVAYDLATGGFVWGGGADGAGYSSPFLATLAQAGQILIFNAHSLAAHDPQSGVLLWSHPWKAGHPHVAMPVALPGDRVLVSSGYGTGSELLRISREAGGPWGVERVWKSIRLKAKFTNVVPKNGFIYGLDDGILVCLDTATGEQKWKEGRYGHGQVILVGDLLLIMAESGEVVLVDPVPDRHRELTRFRALRGKTWNPPALAGDWLLVRNDSEAACYRLPVEGK